MKPTAVPGDILVRRGEHGQTFTPVGCPHGGHATFSTAELCAEACEAVAYAAPELMTTPTAPRPATDVIDVLRDCLDMAERGEIQAVLVAYVDADGVTSSAFATDGETAVGLLGELEVARAGVLDEAIVARETPDDEAPAPAPRLRSVKN